MDIITIETDNLHTLRDYLASIVECIDNGAAQVQIATDVDGAKFKVNGGIWSPGIGQR
jgi:hypothetical protein